jgi:carboxymethylenebutenolidase
MNGTRRTIARAPMAGQPSIGEDVCVSIALTRPRSSLALRHVASPLAKAAIEKAGLNELSQENTMGKTIDYKRPDGRSVSGYLAEPTNATAAPGIVVIQEWWGLNDQIKGVADTLAAAGYRALVPDLYRGKVALEANEAEHLMTGLDFGDAAGQDVRGAVQYLKASGSAKVGVTGFCMGGALTLLSAVNVAEADACVVWYGFPPLEYVDATRIKAPLLAHWGTEDTVFAIAKVDALETKLRDAHVKFEFHRYHAKHAFANETADAKNLPYLKHDAAAARLAWQRTMDFLGRHLK